MTKYLYQCSKQVIIITIDINCTLLKRKCSFYLVLVHEFSFYLVLVHEFDQRVIDFSLRHLNFSLNELHKKDNRYCIYSKGEFIFKNHIYLEEHQLIHRKGFISLTINTYAYDAEVRIFIKIHIIFSHFKCESTKHNDNTYLRQLQFYCCFFQIKKIFKLNILIAAHFKPSTFKVWSHRTWDLHLYKFKSCKKKYSFPPIASNVKHCAYRS